MRERAALRLPAPRSPERARRARAAAGSTFLEVAHLRPLRVRAEARFPGTQIAMIFTMPATIVSRTRWVRSVVFAAGTFHCALHAQTAAPPGLRFDVASVRPNSTARCRGRWDFGASHGLLSAENAPLLRIISRAYNLTDDRVSGPAWIESQCYDVRAKASGDVPDQDLMPMLKELLQERFHLVAHRESNERPIFVLSVDKGGSKVHPYGAKISAPSSSNDGKILFTARHLPDLCERLARVTGRPVIDKTGLTGDYQIELSYLPFVSADSASSDPAADIFSAVRDQLGLRLESQRGVVDVLKVVSVDKVPTGN
jgi:uncharacterized protein (TIGR03435 family)